MTEFRLEDNDKQDRDDVKEFIEDISYHFQSEETAEQNEYQDKEHTLQELPCSGITDDLQDIVKNESNEDDINDITNEIQRATEEQIAAVQT